MHVWASIVFIILSAVIPTIIIAGAFVLLCDNWPKVERVLWDMFFTPDFRGCGKYQQIPPKQ